MFVYFQGLILGLSLIMTLGPQNIFLIRQGARKNHAALSSVVCFFCDMLLATASITGLHQLLFLHPALQIWMIWLGSTFLFYYAVKSLRSALKTRKTQNDAHHMHHNKMQIMLFALGFSLLNPHAIIDTIVIIGSGSTRFPNHELMFLFGVITSSLLWFSSLFFTTRYFSNILTKAAVWQSIEFFSGIIMIYIGFKLVLGNI